MEALPPGYISLNSTRTGGWGELVVGLLGMKKTDRGAGVRAYRMIDRRQRLVTDDWPHGCACLGWDVAYATALERVAARLKAHGTPLRRTRTALAWTSASLRRRAFVGDLR